MCPDKVRPVLVHPLRPDVQKSLQLVNSAIEAQTSSQDRFMFAGWLLSGRNCVEHRQGVALGAAVDVTPNTAKNWIKGHGGCSVEAKVFQACRMCFAHEWDLYVAIDTYFGLGLFEDGEK